MTTEVFAFSYPFNSFIMYPIVLNAGIDVSKDKFDVYLEYLFSDRSVKKAGNRVFDNTVRGIDKFLVWINKRNKKQSEIHLTMEATGRYHEELAYTLFEQGFKTSIVLPNKIKHFARSLNEYSKTDAVDARILAAYTTKHQPEKWEPSSPLMRQLREYTRERQRFIKSKTMAINRLHAIRTSRYPEPRTIDRLESQITFYSDQIEQIEEDIAELRLRDAELNENVKLLISIPNIGVVTACVILAETGGFALFKNRSQLIKYAGLDIIEKQSGSSVNGRGRISKRGNAHLRTSPYMGAVGAVGRTSIFQETYERHFQKHGNKSKAVTAVMRQLLKVAYGVFKSRQPYDENVHALRTQKGVGELKNSPTVTHLVA